MAANNTVSTHLANPLDPEDNPVPVQRQYHTVSTHLVNPFDPEDIPVNPITPVQRQPSQREINRVMYRMNRIPPIPVLPFETIMYYLRRALEHLYEESDYLSEMETFDDAAHEQQVKAEKRYFQCHVIALQALEKVLVAMKNFLIKVQRSFSDYNLLLQQFTPESETFELLDALEPFIIKLQRFQSRHEASRPFFHSPTLD